MPEEKSLKARMIQKHGTEANWEVSSFTPKAGELVLITDTKNIRIGDGDTQARNLKDIIPNDLILNNTIKKSVSGSIVSFDDGGDNVPVLDLAVNIGPVQNSSLSNIRSISGQTGCAIQQMGKNLLDDTKRVFAGGNIFFGGATSQTAGLSAFLPSGNYTFSVETADGTVTNLYVKNKLKNEFVSGFPAYDKKSQSFTLDEATEIIVFVYKLEYTSTSDILTAQIEVGDFATAYTPYAQIATYNVDWSNDAGTVYGGALNVTTGVLTSTLDENGDPLPAPMTYQLTPQEIRTLLGHNSIWADTGDITITYRADPTIVIENITKAIISLGGNV